MNMYNKQDKGELFKELVESEVKTNDVLDRVQMELVKKLHTELEQAIKVHQTNNDTENFYRFRDNAVSTYETLEKLNPVIRKVVDKHSIRGTPSDLEKERKMLEQLIKSLKHSTET